MRNTWKQLLAVLALSFTSNVQATDPNNDWVSIVVPSFDGPEPLSQIVSTILYIDIWRTLRKEPTPNPKKLSFGNGSAYWQPERLASQSHVEAEKLLTGTGSWGAQMCFWGAAWEYGDGVVVQPYLSVIDNPFDGRKTRPERWKVTVDVHDDKVLFEVGLPVTRCNFSPITLPKEFVAQQSTAIGLQLYEDRKLTKVIGTMDNDFEASRHEGDRAQVTSHGRSGWIRIPRLPRPKSEATNFTSAVIKVMRGDWEEAIQLLTLVVTNPETPRSLLIDSHLLLALSSEKQGQSGLKHIEAADALNPHLQGTIRYQIMEYLTQYAKSNNKKVKATILNKIQATVNERKYLFPADDEWISKVTVTLRKLSEANDP